MLGVPAFEVVSPVAMVHRELIFGAGLGLLAAGAIFLFELYGTPGGWCGHLCPLGAFYSLVGRAPRVRPVFRRERCDRCLDCVAVCPEPAVTSSSAIVNASDAPVASAPAALPSDVVVACPVCVARIVRAPARSSAGSPALLVPSLAIVSLNPNASASEGATVVPDEAAPAFAVVVME